MIVLELSKIERLRRTANKIHEMLLRANESVISPELETSLNKSWEILANNPVEIAYSKKEQEKYKETEKLRNDPEIQRLSREFEKECRIKKPFSS